MDEQNEQKYLRRTSQATVLAAFVAAGATVWSVWLGNQQITEAKKANILTIDQVRMSKRIDDCAVLFAAASVFHDQVTDFRNEAKFGLDGSLTKEALVKLVKVQETLPHLRTELLAAIERVDILADEGQRKNLELLITSSSALVENKAVFDLGDKVDSMAFLDDSKEPLGISFQRDNSYHSFERIDGTWNDAISGIKSQCRNLGTANGALSIQ